MNSPAFHCEIIGDRMRCTLCARTPLEAPVLCYSAIAPTVVHSGGTVVRQLGSYSEIQLPDLAANSDHVIELGYPGAWRPVNRAWLPLGPYLRIKGQTIPLPQVGSGCRPLQITPDPDYQGLRMVPLPTTWAPSGKHLPVRGFTCDDPIVGTAAALAQRRGLSPLLAPSGAVLRVVRKPMDAAAYQITIDREVTVTAGSDAGVFYAATTLATLLTTHHGDLPCGQITDAPRFDWRGFHLDCARHFYQPETILDLLDVMALLKMNRFHWHFADDEAFRLEIDSYPQLWQQTTMRGEGYDLPAIFAGAPVSGGSYSKAVVRHIIAHAKALQIEIMPEIETPAHALALTTVFEDLRDPGDNGQEVSVQGYRRNVVNPAMPKTWEVLSAVIAEVGALFPFGHLHLGCDELPTDTWMSSPAARKLMAQEGLTDTDGLQEWTMQRLAAIAVANGQQVCAWEEAAKGPQGGIGHDTLLFSWTGQGPGQDAARAGYRVVMTPAPHTYLDMAQTDDPDDWGGNWAGFVGLDDTIGWDVVPKDEPALAAQIAGVQGCFWSEFTTQDHQMWPMIMPRILGVAAMGWQQQPMDHATLRALAGDYITHQFAPSGIA